MKEKNYIDTIKKFMKENWLFGISTIALIIIINSVLMVNVVVGSSMYPTFHDGQRLLSTRIINNLERGDVVMIHSEDLNEDIIKRIVAIPGDSVFYSDGLLMVNDEIIDEDYINSEEVVIDTNDIYIQKLKEDEYFVLGDNRNHSSDSRIFGTINRSEIFGKFLIQFF